MRVVWLVLLVAVIAGAAFWFYVWMLRGSDDDIEADSPTGRMRIARRVAARARTGLTFGQKVQIRWAVERGAAVEDLALTSATVAAARATAETERYELSRSTVTRLAWPIGLLVVVGARLVDASGSVSMLDLVLLVVGAAYAVLILAGSPHARGRLARAEQAERLNR